MTPKQALEAMCEDKTETWVTAQIAATGVSVSQPTLNRIRRGDIRRTSFETGEAILKVYKRWNRRQRANS